MVDDIQSNLLPPPEEPVSRRLGAYKYFVTDQRNVIYQNVAAYVNKLY